MEIILDNVSYSSNHLEEQLNNVNYIFKESITFVNGISAKLLYDLLFSNKKCKSGYVALNKTGKYYDVVYLSNNISFNKSNIYEEVTYLNDYYHLNIKRVDKRIKDALKMVNLDVTYLRKSFSEMSMSELKLSKIAISLYLNPKILIFDYFEKGLNFKDINYLKKLVSKLNKMYNKNIIIFSNDIDNYLNIIKNIVIFNEGNIVFDKNSSNLYDNDLYNYIAKPYIIEIIEYLNKKGHKFDNYIDIKELLKAIYRDVENK